MLTYIKGVEGGSKLLKIDHSATRHPQKFYEDKDFSLPEN